MALFVREITSACFCRISQHQQVYLSTIEYQRASLRILPIENYNLPFMRPKIPYLSSLLVTCHQSSRLYGVDLRSTFVDSIVVFDCPLCEVFIEYRPTVNISQNNLKQGLLGIVYIFHISVIKKYVSIPDMRQSKTLGEQSMNASQISLQPVFSIANFRQSGD